MRANRRLVLAAAGIALLLLIGAAWLARDRIAPAPSASSIGSGAPSHAIDRMDDDATQGAPPRIPDSSSESSARAERDLDPRWELRGRVKSRSGEVVADGSVVVRDRNGAETEAALDRDGRFVARLPFLSLIEAKVKTKGAVVVVDHAPPAPPPRARVSDGSPPFVTWEIEIAEPWTIVGRVVELESGEPVEDVLVQLCYGDSRGARKKLHCRSTRSGAIRFDAIGMEIGELMVFPKLEGVALPTDRDCMEPLEAVQRATTATFDARMLPFFGDGRPNRSFYPRERGSDVVDLWPTKVPHRIALQTGQFLDLGKIEMGAPGRIVFVAEDFASKEIPSRYCTDHVSVTCAPLDSILVSPPFDKDGKTSIPFPPGMHSLRIDGEWDDAKGYHTVKMDRLVSVPSGGAVTVSLEDGNRIRPGPNKGPFCAQILTSWDHAPIEGARVEVDEIHATTSVDGFIDLGSSPPKGKFHVTCARTDHDVVAEDVKVNPRNPFQLDVYIPPPVFIKLDAIDERGIDVENVDAVFFTQFPDLDFEWSMHDAIHSVRDSGFHSLPFAPDASELQGLALRAGNWFAWIAPGRLHFGDEPVHTMLREFCERETRVIRADGADVGIGDVQLWATPRDTPPEILVLLAGGMERPLGISRTQADGWFRIKLPRRDAIVRAQRDTWTTKDSEDGHLVELCEYDDVDELPPRLMLH